MTSKDIEVTPKISYTIGGKIVKYVLSSDFDGSTNLSLALNGGSGIDSLKIIGLIQGSTGTSQNIIGFENISGIHGQDAKSQIKKSITIATRWMNGSGQISDGIKYINGTDFDLSSFPTDYETLVVTNANVIISWDIVVPTWKKFAIVAFNDDQTDLSKGNIYVKKDVGYIEALLVADGGIVSTGWSTWNDRLPNYVTDSNRSDALTKQLVIRGSAITNNTIWGAIKGTNSKYGLPLGETTDNLSLATALDLNYLRTSNLLRDASKNLWNTENTVIIYNPDIVKNPPKGFIIQ